MNPNGLNYLSICSGIEAASVAWEPLGWNPIGFSEIEPFPCAVLKHHYPNVPNFGDMTRYADWNPSRTIDVVAGGTPCQSFSIAGLRRGLADPRGNLMLTFLGIVERFQPRFVVWENVPGVLSSNAGRDFGTFLGALEYLGFRWAYRTLDAQYVRTRRFPKAVPQRRRRIFVVGYRGERRSAETILFERQSGGRDSSPREETWKNDTAGIEGSFRTAGKRWPVDVAPKLRAKAGSGEHPVITYHEHVANTLIKRPTATSFGNLPISLVAPTVTSKWSKGYGGPSGNETGNLTIVERTENFAVRRLMPIECERLQGFPDNYTQIPWRNRPAELCADGPRYTALGNSMAVNVMEWLGMRIQAAAERGE